MFLKRIEIKGFKSFAEAMNIEFVPGVNAVVGPNGSGKSNVSDAIRWVLGEQSARSLRGAKMEDIIFAGSDTRKPMNASEVTLVLENDDQYLDLEYHEVSVTRKLYRTGDSEYLINRQSCRRKDIVELFMDSGMGKEAFSIIGQGRVEEVLSSKPEERRAIFEEAAGVSKYKQRKSQAEKKLSETEDNLNRVEDILHELENQVEPLKEQASMAKDYLAKKEELEEKDIALTAAEIEQKHQRWSALQDTIGHLEEQQKKTDSLVKEQEQKRSESEAKAEEIDETISRIQNDLVNVSENLEKEEGRRRVLEERGKNAGEKKEEWEKRCRELREKSEQSRKEWENQARIMKESSSRYQSLEQNYASIQEEWKKYKESRREEIESLKSEYIERLNEQAAVRNEEKYLEEQKKQLQHKHGSLAKENQEYVKERTQAEKLVENARVKKDKAAADHEQEKETWKHLQETWKEQSESVEQLEQKLYEAYRHVDQTRSRIHVLEEMEADYSGFYQGVREVLKAGKDTLTGVVGAVAELIDVPKSYTLAVETALGGALQNVVTKTEEDARKAIQLLKTRQKGRATILPSEVIRPRRLSSDFRNKLQSADGFITTASEAVNIDEGYRHIIDHLLGQVVLAESLEAANQMARLTGYKVRIVTLDGNVVNPGGSMTGGSSGKNSSQILARQNELEELREKHRDMQAKTETLEGKVRQEKQNRDETAAQLEESRRRGEEARDALEQAKEELTGAEADLEKANSKLSMYDKESSSLEEEEERLQSREKVLMENKESVAKKLRVLDEQIEELEKQEKERGEKLEQLKDQETDIKVKLAGAKESASNDETEEKRLKKQWEEESAQLEKLEHDIAVLEEQMSSMEGDEDVETGIEKLREEKESLSREMAKLRRDRVEAGDDTQQRKSRIQQLTHERNEKQQELQNHQIELNRLDVELDTRLEHLQANYEISFERARDQYPLTEDLEETRKRMELVKRGIDELGNVNLGAIDEYERVHERVTFLHEQQKDLQQARNSLKEVIQEMDDEMKRRFSETFEAIRYHFRYTFQELFGGGEADLELTDPDHLLHTGVDIAARPPGKKRQNLSLLSGGEKALTAIALLFSIVKEKPAPFCVLDEVEAALDEANLSRFAKYLRTFSETTQFIVISHRKATMEEADVLYGITMEESGVSRMVSVKMEDAGELVESAAP
ncbi:chromosome segregation protein SMC [Salibacterium qingdaonense]|uniref:Chromosome partition protein Smc n=1 Tax=Salibacterium qingdaonense TaxID=266892 RepID=A0A1I4PFY6_9BACI|nr:chromosome segregation protein SMC [Salibacterium qingdaonense]SFM26681.1 condensin subunit Smc [Salibacterium qingdaonense]